MSAIPVLKKKLKSVKATGKLSKAMKTVSAAKYSRLASIWKDYSVYTDQYRFLYTSEDDSSDKIPDTVVLLGSNRGFCGSFNNDIISYYLENIAPFTPGNLIVCGEELISALDDIGANISHRYIFDDVPSFDSCNSFFSLLEGLAGEKENYPILFVNPKYINTMTQTPNADLFLINPTDRGSIQNETLYIPDATTVLSDILEKGFHALVFSKVLETALGAQASTLMTMRSAYDTATEYTETLEGEIHRLRQSEVTSDVIETAADHGAKEDNNQ